MDFRDIFSLVHLSIHPSTVSRSPSGLFVANSRLQYLGLIDPSSSGRSERTDRSKEPGGLLRPSSTESVRRNLPRRMEPEGRLGATKQYYQLRTSLSALPLDTGRLTDPAEAANSDRRRHQSTTQQNPMPSSEPRFSQSLKSQVRPSGFDDLRRPRSASSQPPYSRLTNSYNSGLDAIQ